jgi:hypothetical protein
VKTGKEQHISKSGTLQLAEWRDAAAVKVGVLRYSVQSCCKLVQCAFVTKASGSMVPEGFRASTAEHCNTNQKLTCLTNIVFTTTCRSGEITSKLIGAMFPSPQMSQLHLNQRPCSLPLYV